MARIIPTRHVQGVRHGWHLFRNRRTLWQMLREAMRGQYRMSLMTNIILVFSLIYIISPIDLIPDFIPVVGWIDDGLVLYLLLKRLTFETQRYMRFKAMERKSRPNTIIIE